MNILLDLFFCQISKVYRLKQAFYGKKIFML